MSDYFPPEILYLILTRLPVKSLCRFTLVSKSWYALITSQAFISSHLNQTLTTNTLTSHLLRFYCKQDKQEHYTLHPDTDCQPDPSRIPYSLGLPPLKLKLPVKTKPGYFRIVGSCDGLLCLSDDYFREKAVIVLWNPSIQRHVTLTSPGIMPSLPHMFVLGFGKDVLRMDYKVVRIVYLAKNDINGYEVPPEVEVCSLKERVWRRIMSADVVCNIMQFMWSHANVNGHSHWIAWKDDGRTVLVLSFDMSDEVFREISLPDGLARENLMVNVYGESLAVMEYRRDTVTGFCCVWVMKEYGVPESWTNLYRIDLDSGLDRVVGFRKDCKVFMVKAGDQLVLYDPETKDVMDLGILGTERSFYADKYVESLLLLEGRHGVLVDDLSQLVAHGCRIEEVNGDVERLSDTC